MSSSPAMVESSQACFAEGPIRVGSEAHKTLFCRTLDTLIWERIGIARDVGSGAQDNNFTVTGAKAIADDIDVAELIDICLAENERRMKVYDRRLFRPFAVPALAKLARRFMRSGAKQKKRA